VSDERFACTIELRFNAAAVELALMDGAALGGCLVLDGVTPGSKLIGAEVTDGELSLTFGCERNEPRIYYVLRFVPSEPLDGEVWDQMPTKGESS
jgi:hypothetical protein